MKKLIHPYQSQYDRAAKLPASSKAEIIKLAVGFANNWFEIEGYTHRKSCNCKACDKAREILRLAGVHIGFPQPPPERDNPGTHISEFGPKRKWAFLRWLCGQ